jgi:hypothetical protein
MQGALRVSAALDGLAPRWSRAPRQVLARLHLLAARGSVADDELGRPATAPVDAGRLDTLCALIAAEHPRCRRCCGRPWCTAN